MTVIIHPVGNGDLGNDIVDLNSKERLTVQAERLRELQEIIDEADPEDLAAALLDLPEGSRFEAKPLALILNALKGECKSAKILLLGVEGGDEGTKTDAVVRLLEKSLQRDGVRERIKRRVDIDVEVQSVYSGNLFERAAVERLREVLEGVDPEEDVIVSGISGATMVVFAAMGVADQLGLNWRLAVAPGADTRKAAFVDRSSYSDAPFYWLRSLGYLEEAEQWVNDRYGGKIVIDAVHREMITILKNYRTRPEALSEADLGTVARLDMARADNGAGLTLRAWMQKHYEALCEGNNESNLFDPGEGEGKGRVPMVGTVIKEARERKKKLGAGCPVSAEWILSRERINDIGKASVHQGAAPTAADVRYVMNLKELPGRLPDWVSRPESGPVLYIFACGKNSRGPAVPERVLCKPVDAELKRAVPGAMLAGAPPLPVEFLILHSAAEDSKRTALASAASALTSNKDETWSRKAPSIDRLDYGSGNEYEAAPAIMSSVRRHVKLALNAKRPVAVVIVGTGQKPAAYGALQAAQAWCAINAVPLFLQTFIDGDSKKSGSQFHRIALHNDAETALRRAATAGLRSFNLLSVIRVLSAGDRDMDRKANVCNRLRQEYLDAANAADPDDHACVLISVLRVIRDLCARSRDGYVDPRLAVVAAETVKFNPRGKKEPETLFREDYAWRNRKDSAPARIDLLSRGDLLRMLAEVRNRLVVTHGGSSVLKATRDALADLSISAPGDFTYTDLLARTVTALEKAAPGLGIKIDDSWASSFKCLLKWAED
ncbi:hypothetical protein [Actinomyces dentalis]|jgi:hypothetical protein|uniref:hypothetical protein n=1 Tax=Actinomyces dentalis TaxID=272548 RepID=UPI002354F051|nr:hypothetical protein [Actinomyces dentalis]